MAFKYVLPTGHQTDMVMQTGDGSGKAGVYTGIVAGHVGGVAVEQLTPGVLVEVEGKKKWGRVDAMAMLSLVWMVIVNALFKGPDVKPLQVLWLRLAVSFSLVSLVRYEYIVSMVAVAIHAHSVAVGTDAGVLDHDYNMHCMMLVLWLAARALVSACRVCGVQTRVINGFVFFVYESTMVCKIGSMLYHGFRLRGGMEVMHALSAVVCISRRFSDRFAVEEWLILGILPVAYPSPFRLLVLLMVWWDMITIDKTATVVQAARDMLLKVWYFFIESFQEEMRKRAESGCVAQQVKAESSAVEEEDDDDEFFDVVTELNTSVLAAIQDTERQTVWDTVGTEPTGAKPEVQLRRLALAGDKLLNFALEVWGYHARVETKGYMSNVRQTLLSNRSMADYFDRAVVEVFPDMIDRSVERKATVVEAMVANAFGDLDEVDSLIAFLAAIADLTGQKSLMQVHRASFPTGAVDSGYDAGDMAVLWSVACVDGEFPWSEYAETVGPRDLSRSVIKRLARVGRAAFEARIAVDHVSDSEMTVERTTNDIARAFNDVSLFSAYKSLQVLKGAGLPSTIVAKTAAENFLAFVGAYALMERYEAIDKTFLWYNHMVSSV